MRKGRITMQKPMERVHPEGDLCKRGVKNTHCARDELMGHLRKVGLFLTTAAEGAQTMNSTCMRQRRWVLPGAARASGTARATTLRVPEPAAAREGAQHEPAPPRPSGASTRSRGGVVYQGEGDKKPNAGQLRELPVPPGHPENPDLRSRLRLKDLEEGLIHARGCERGELQRQTGLPSRCSTTASLGVLVRRLPLAAWALCPA